MSKESALAMLTGEAPTIAADPSTTVPVVGSATEIKPEATKELDSSRFARLAKHEAKLQAERAALKTEQEAQSKEKEQLRDVRTKIQEFETLKKTDPVAALKFLGFSEADLINFLSAEDLSPEQKAAKAAEDKIKEYEDKRKAELDAEAKLKIEAEAKVQAAAIQKFRAELSTLITSDKDKYEFCNYYGSGAEELAFDTVVECLNTDRETNPEAQPISAQEAIEMVERFYEESDKAMNSLKKRMPNTPTPTTVAEKPEKPSIGRAMPTTESKTHQLKEQPNPAERSPANAISNPKSIAKAKATAAAAQSTVPIKETMQQKKDRLIAKIKSGGFN